MLNLVKGDEAVVESPRKSFEPLVVHYAETFIIPAAIGEYTIRPHGPSIGKECATIKAFIRGSILTLLDDHERAARRPSDEIQPMANTPSAAPPPDSL